MKSGQFMSYYRRKIFMKKFYKNSCLKTVPGPFVFAKNEAKLLLENEIFEASWLCWICNSKAIKICPNQHADLLRIFFTENSLKIKKDLEQTSRPQRIFLLIW